MSRPARSTHGEYGFAHMKACDCDPCVEAIRIYVKRLALDKHRGISRRKDATETRDHVQQLLDAGCTITQISHATGSKVHQAQIRNLMYGNATYDKEVTWLFQSTIDSLLAVTFEDAMKHDALIPPCGIERRLRALQYMGHSIPSIAVKAGVTTGAAYRWMNQDRSRAVTRTKVKKVYDELSMVPGEDVRTKWNAYREGWPPPLAWDDATIDDPDAEPDLSMVACVVATCTNRVRRSNLCDGHYRTAREMGGFEKVRNYKPVVERLGAHHYNRQRLLSDLATLKELGYTAQRAAWRLGRSQSYIEKVWNQA